MKEKIVALFEAMDKTGPGASISVKLTAVGKIMELMGIVQEDDVEIPADIFEAFDDSLKRKLLILSFLMLSLNELQAAEE